MRSAEPEAEGSEPLRSGYDHSWPSKADPKGAGEAVHCTASTRPLFILNNWTWSNYASSGTLGRMQMNAGKKVFVGMSGGVDSSVTALLLKEQGYDVVGVFIKSWDGLKTDQGTFFREQCRWRDDRRDAMRVAAALKIPFLTYDFTEEYREKVIEYFFAEYAAGRTPNPDIMCNKEIKFKVFLERALREGADFVATGHYARVQRSRASDGNPREARVELLTGIDDSKDQSYFLYTLQEAQLKHVLMPVGELKKAEVRALAEKHNLITAKKPDSQGICFVGEVPMEDFLRARIPETVGAVMTMDGKVIGEHKGVPFYTIGQRHGLKISSALPYYVAKKDAEKNIVYVAQGNADEALFVQEALVTNVSWVNETPVVGFTGTARIRYRQPRQAVTLVAQEGEVWRFQFAEEQRAVTSGQSLVLYDGDRVVGGGIIL